METITFCNICFRGLTKQILLKEEENMKIIVTVNAEFVVRANNDINFMKILNENFSTFDGQITYYLAKIKNPGAKFEFIAGCDFIDDVCEFAKNNRKKVFLLGGYKKSNEIAVKKLKEKYGIKIDGYSPEFKPYPFTESHNDLILKKIKNFCPHFLFVGFGAVKQEKWIDQFRYELNNIGVKWAIGSGGTFEFVSGIIPKPPTWIRRIGLASIARLIQEPKILRLKRIFLSLKIFKYLFV
jgi:N-acetylglucosaminyldiphosphoundecaprenol N-acetyl-beta-D-mannosaminyltransferase